MTPPLCSADFLQRGDGPMPHAVINIDRPDTIALPARHGDAAELVATARSALDRRAMTVVGTCLDRLAGMLAANPADIHTTEPPPPTKGGLAAWQLRRIDALVKDELHAIITVETMANAVQLSAAHFCRAFKSSTGHTPHAYLMRHRVLRAQALMLRSDAPLSEIACACGLADQSHLARMFRRLVGETPRAWRRHAQAAGRPTGALAITHPTHQREFTT